MLIEELLRKYVEILEKAKIIYSCDLFDIKSKKVLDGEKILFGRLKYIFCT